MTEYKLPPKTLLIWRIRTIALFFCIYALFLFVLKQGLFFWILSLLLFAACLLIIFGFLPRFYKKYGLELHSHAVVIKKGVFIEREYIMPYGGMIYAELVETPLCKKFGVMAIQLHAAKKRLGISPLERDRAKEFIRYIREKEIQ